MKWLLVLMGLTIGSICNAGNSFGEPPASFTSSTILVQTRSGVANRNLKLREFVEKMKDAGKVSWGHADKDSWVLQVDSTDEANGKIQRISMVFKPYDANSVVLVRMNAAGTDFLPKDNMLLTMADKFFMPMLSGQLKDNDESEQHEKDRSAAKAKKNTPKPESDGEPQVIPGTLLMPGQ